MDNTENIGEFLYRLNILYSNRNSQNNQILKPVMLNYAGEYCEAGNPRQSSVAVLGAAKLTWNTNASAEQLTVTYVIGDSMTH